MLVDLDYDEDSTIDTDLNVVMNEHGKLIEIQGTAEGEAMDTALVFEAINKPTNQSSFRNETAISQENP